MFSQLSLAYFDIEENLKTWWFLGRFWSYREHLFSMISKQLICYGLSVSHTGAKNMPIMSVGSNLSELWCLTSLPWHLSTTTLPGPVVRLTVENLLYFCLVWIFQLKRNLCFAFAQSCPVPQKNVWAFIHPGVSEFVHVPGKPQQNHSGLSDVHRTVLSTLLWFKWFRLERSPQQLCCCCFLEFISGFQGRCVTSGKIHAIFLPCYYQNVHPVKQRVFKG